MFNLSQFTLERNDDGTYKIEINGMIYIAKTWLEAQEIIINKNL